MLRFGNEPIDFCPNSQITLLMISSLTEASNKNQDSQSISESKTKKAEKSPTHPSILLRFGNEPIENSPNYVLTLRVKPLYTAVYSVSGNSPSDFRKRTSILREQVTITKVKKQPKKTIVYIVFLKKQEKTDCNTIVTAFCNKTPSFHVVSTIARNSICNTQHSFIIP